jgi:hypothetical protein
MNTLPKESEILSNLHSEAIRALRRTSAAFEDDADMRFAIQQVLDPLKKMLDCVSGVENSVCLKQLHSRDRILTYARDTAAGSRWRIDSSKREYFYREHTPFAQLVDERARTPSGEPVYSGHYLNNSIEDDPAYRNGNPDYRIFYNAVLVVPITHPAAKVSPHQRLFGFLCADSLIGNYDMHCVSIMREMAIQIYEVFEELTRGPLEAPFKH